MVGAQVWRPPTAMAATPLVSPVTSTGLLRCVVVPSPTSPVLFQPQHLAPPVVVRAQVWWPPETTAATPPVSPATSVGVVQTTLPQLCPSPNWPFSFFPQHVTAPNMVRAQVWYCPAERATTSLPSPTTAAGMARNASWVPPVPSPSWPHWFRPQHWTPPDIVSAQVCSPPAAMAVTPPVSATTSTGLVRSVVVPSPSWPYELSPQHWTPPAVVNTQVCWSPPSKVATLSAHAGSGVDQRTTAADSSRRMMLALNFTRMASSTNRGGDMASIAIALKL